MSKKNGGFNELSRIAGAVLLFLLVGCGGSERDVAPPVITLNGSDVITLAVNQSYNEQGATYTDNVDGGGPVSIIDGVVNLSVVGSYTLTYRKTDSSGNAGTAHRTIIVVDPKPVASVLPNLTVDDEFSLSINAGGASDTMGRALIYTMSMDTSGIPIFSHAIAINATTGVITSPYLDIAGDHTIPVLVTVTAAGSSNPLVRSFELTIRDTW